MAIGSRGERRPADVIGAAVIVGRIATGKIEEQVREPSGKVRSELGGAKVRNESMSKEDRGAVARKVAWWQ